MKKLVLTASLLVVSFCAFAQTNIQQIAKGGKGSTNWVVIPYGKYDLSSKQYGFGAAILYKQNDSLWTGLRVDRIDGEQTSAGVQAQLKTDMTIFGVTSHPFAETSFGLGQSSLYGSAGAGAYVMLFSKQWTRSSGQPITFDMGVIGDYEHVVYVGSSQNNNNQVNVGPLLHLSF